MNRGRSYIISVGFAAAGLGLIAPAVAQEVSGLTASFGIRQSIETSDNLNLEDPVDAGTQGVTRLSFGLASQTQTSRLAFDASGRFEFGDNDTGFADPTASLSYTTGSRNSQLALQANYSETEVSTLNDVVADDGGFGLFVEPLVTGSGTRLRSGASLRFETGIDAPLGLTVRLGYSAVDYRNTGSNPDLFETERLTYGATLRMRLNSSANLRLRTELEEYEAQDASNTIRNNASIFLEGDYAIRSDLSATTRLSYARNETTAATALSGFGFGSGRTLSVDEGFGGGFAITKTLKSGTIGADFDTRVTSDGRRDTVRFIRAVELPRGSFSLSVGAVKTETSDPEPLFEVSYNQQLPRGVLALGLSQQASIGDNDETVINTGLRASYNQEINSSSSWGLTAALANTNAVDTGDDTQRLDLGINYRHDLARDWGLVANYAYSTSDQTEDASRSSNTVSLSLEKSFTFRP